MKKEFIFIAASNIFYLCTVNSFAADTIDDFSLTNQDSICYIWMEAEDGGEHNPIIVKSDQSASQQIYLASWSDKTSLSNPPSDGNILYSFNIPFQDTFSVWIRIITPDTLSNSYWIKADSSDWRIWENIGPFESWNWKSFDTNFFFTEGMHTLNIAYREKGTKLDKFLLTNDFTYIPAGFGEPVPKPTGSNNYRADVVEKYGNLQVIGTRLCDENGEAVQLRGLNTHGIQWFPIYKDLTIPNAVEYFGIDIVRPAMYVEDWIGDDFWNGYLAHPEEVKQWEKDFIEDAIDAGVYVVIDWHLHNDPSPFTQSALDFFAEMSAAYGQYPNIIFDICNEPLGGVTWSTIKNYAEQIIPVIRNNDPDNDENIIIVGTPNWCQYVDVSANDPIVGYNNIIYALHFYAASHTNNYRKRALDALLGTNSMGNNPNKNQIPLIASEWGTSDYGASYNDFSQSQKWIDLLNEHVISWINWSLSNKDEATSIFQPTVSLAGPWTDSDLTISGRWVKTLLESEGSTEIFQEENSSIVNEYKLAQNYPNPFNPDTRITFVMPQEAKVTLNVYNVVGQLIKTLVDETKSAGQHSVQWNGTNNFGEKTGSGIYFYKIISDNFTAARKMVILK